MEDSEPADGPNVYPPGLRRQTSRRGPPRRAHVPASSHEAIDPAFSVHFTPLLRDLMEAAPVAAFVKVADGGYAYANPYFSRLILIEDGLDSARLGEYPW